jgi:hypothetical protein
VPAGTVPVMTTFTSGTPGTPGAAHQFLTARTPDDVLAAVPLVLGFVPEESVVMLTFGAQHPFHARLDLPRSARERRAAAEALVEPAVRHRVRRVLFVLYAVDATLARSCARALVRAFTRRGVDVLDVLRSDGTCWFVLPLDPTATESSGTPYDVTGHLFTAQSVAAGRVTRASRAELAASVAPDVAAARAVGAAARAGGSADGTDVGWVRATVARLAAGDDPPDPATSARLLVALREPGPRDAVLAAVDREEAGRRLPMWSALVRSAPADLVAPVASVLAFHAWLAGDGALAWCALERAAEGEPSCSLADVVAEALEQALPPSLWERR